MRKSTLQECFLIKSNHCSKHLSYHNKSFWVAPSQHIVEFPSELSHFRNHAVRQRTRAMKGICQRNNDQKALGKNHYHYSWLSGTRILQMHGNNGMYDQIWPLVVITWLIPERLLPGSTVDKIYITQGDILCGYVECHWRFLIGQGWRLPKRLQTGADTLL